MTAKPEEDPQIRAQLEGWAQEWRTYTANANDARAELSGWIIKARKAGHSFRQIREATGLSVGAIQMDLKKAELAELAELLSDDDT